MRLQLEQLLRLPRQHGIRQPLERLAEHDELAGQRIARTKVQVRQPALPTTVTPFDAEDHQVERVDWLDLDPPGPTPACLIARIDRFHHDAFMTARHRLAQELLTFSNV